MYRIKIKRGPKWRIGITGYSTYEEAKQRAEYFSSTGLIVAVCDETGLEVTE